MVDLIIILFLVIIGFILGFIIYGILSGFNFFFRISSLKKTRMIISMIISAVIVMYSLTIGSYTKRGIQSQLRPATDDIMNSFETEL